ncbi:hypothetical protein [uncultured Methanobrevibacter sp.]|uniref:hypothetical protein n=1 Tax=uncultured Methanobrevibacter sp. TaxID=253161 RepID=UPI0025E2C4F6|nr:hypothetical protein [uncultured Methanobrevibacter sp.]
MKIEAELLNIAQKLLNIAYEREGATDRVIKLQVRINTYRAETNIHDKDAVFENGYCQ